MSAQAQVPTVRAEYDRAADALYIRLRDAAVARSVEVDHVRVIDLDANGEPVGLEILYPAENLAISSIARTFGFDGLLGEIDEAVALELGAGTQRIPVGIALDYRYPGSAGGGIFIAGVASGSVPSSGTATAVTVATLAVVEAAA